MTTMLGLVQQATGEMGLIVPNAVAGNTSTDTVQQLAIINGFGYDLMRKYQWEALDTELRFYTQFLSTTGTLTPNSAVITGIPSTSTLAANLWMLNGDGVPQDCTILSVDSATQVTMNQPMQVTAITTGVTLTFGQTKYALPADWDRQVDKTHFDKSKRWEMLGPETAQQWQWLKSSYISTGPRIRYRILGGYFQTWPLMNTNEYLGCEYISKNWALSASGTGKASFTADNDTCVFPDRLMINGLKYRYMMAKGMGDIYAAAYEDELTQSKPNDAGSPTLSMCPRLSTVLVGYENLPDSGIGQ